MNKDFKIIACIFFVLSTFCALSQSEEEDLEFKSIKKSKQHTKIENGLLLLETKRKFNVHLEAGYSLSTVFGKDVLIREDTLNAVKNRYNFDSFTIEPTFFPYAKLLISYNFEEKWSLTFGVNANRIAYKEIAKVDRNNLKYRYYNRLEFYYIGIPIAFNYHINKFASINLGSNVSFLVKNDLEVYEYYILNGNINIDTKERLTFEKAFGFKSNMVVPQLFLGFEIGSKRVRFKSNFLASGNFISSEIKYNSFAFETGVLIKLLNEYD